MASKSKDIYAQFAALNVEEAVANAGVYVKFAFPFSIMDKMALLINRIEYILRANSAYNSSGDSMVAGISVGTNLADVEDVTNPLIVDSVKRTRIDQGTPATCLYLTDPFIKDFSDLPGGGILIAPNPLYAFVKGAGLGAVAACGIRLYYTYRELGTDEYWQLVESRRVITSS